MYRSGNGTSVLDLTFSTSNITQQIENWAVDYDNATGSDHELIKFDIRMNDHKLAMNSTIDKYNYKKANWEKFKTTLNNDNFDEN